MKRKKTIIIITIIAILVITNLYLSEEFHKGIYYPALLVTEVRIIDYYEKPYKEFKIFDRKEIKDLLRILQTSNVDVNGGLELSQYRNNGGRNFLVMSVNTLFFGFENWETWKSPDDTLYLLSAYPNRQAFTCNQLEEWLDSYVELDRPER